MAFIIFVVTLIVRCFKYENQLVNIINTHTNSKVSMDSDKNFILMEPEDFGDGLVDDDAFIFIKKGSNYEITIGDQYICHNRSRIFTCDEKAEWDKKFFIIGDGSCSRISTDSSCLNVIGNRIELAPCVDSKSECFEITPLEPEPVERGSGEKPKEDLEDIELEEKIRDSKGFSNTERGNERNMLEDPQLDNISDSDDTFNRSDTTMHDIDKEPGGGNNREDVGDRKDRRGKTGKLSAIKNAEKKSAQEINDEEFDGRPIYRPHRSLKNKQEQAGKNWNIYKKKKNSMLKDYDMKYINSKLDEAQHIVSKVSPKNVQSKKWFVPECFNGYSDMNDFLNDPLPNLRKMRNKYCLETVNKDIDE